MMQYKWVAVTVLIALLMVTIPAVAGIYKVVDENGRVTYTNAPAKSAQRVKLSSSEPTMVAKAAMTTAPVAMDGFPKVSVTQQKKRDVKRRQILENELAAETRLLAEIHHALNEAEKSVKLIVADRSQLMSESSFFEDEKIKKLRNQAALHERNITALYKELENL